MTFCTCSSPAPTRVKPQPTPAILSQELVHTTLSITHHTRKRPSTGPWTTHGPQSPPWWVHWQHPHKVTREKRKIKETKKRKHQQAIESQGKAKNKITWRRQVSDPLGKGKGSTHPRQNYAQTKSANHRNKARTPQRAPPAHMQAPPEPKHTPPKLIQQCNTGMQQHTPPELIQQCNTGMQQRAKFCSPCPGQLDRLHRAVRPPAPHLTARGAVRPPKETGPAPNCSKISRTNWNTFQTLLGVQTKLKLLPLVNNAWIKAKHEKFQHIASQIYKIHHKELHKSKWAS
jgi:hypothetical protein